LIANILQLAAGILLAISSFIVKNIGFQMIVFGEKVPGTLERLKQMWVIRIGLLLLVSGYALPIANWDIRLPENASIIFRLVIGFGGSLVLVMVSYLIASLLAKRGFNKAPVFTKETPVDVGTIVFEVLESEQ
jgi:uncharacterized membrane protein